MTLLTRIRIHSKFHFLFLSPIFLVFFSYNISCIMREFQVDFFTLKKYFYDYIFLNIRSQVVASLWDSTSRSRWVFGSAQSSLNHFSLQTQGKRNNDQPTLEIFIFNFVCRSRVKWTSKPKHITEFRIWVKFSNYTFLEATSMYY